jgi:hypothetical protein
MRLVRRETLRQKSWTLVSHAFYLRQPPGALAKGPCSNVAGADKRWLLGFAVILRAFLQTFFSPLCVASDHSPIQKQLLTGIRRIFNLQGKWSPM